MKIKAALIDLDDTLTPTRHLYDEALEICCKVFNQKTDLNYSIKKFTKLYMRARAETKAVVPSSAAKHNRAIYFQRLVENLDFETDFDLIYQLYHTYYNYIYDNMEPYEDAPTLLKWLKETGREIVIVSDGNSHVRLEKIHALKISKYVDFLVSSEEVGIDKPASQVFLMALKKVNVTKDESIFVGNKASADIYGAELLDFETILFDSGDPKDKPKNKFEKPDHTISKLVQIIDIIKKIEKEK